MARLKNLFFKVQRGELSVEEAMIESERIFGAELDEATDFKNELKASLENAPLLPRQLRLPLIDIDDEGIFFENVTRGTKLPLPKPPAPVPDLYRIEIWRENRRGERNVRVVNL